MIKKFRDHYYGLPLAINSGRCSKCRESRCVFIDKVNMVFMQLTG